MKKSIFSLWHIRLLLALLTAMVVYLSIGAFKYGREEGKVYKVNMHTNH